jgi:putative aminopeptidase FrvX
MLPVTQIIKSLISIDSPTGYTATAIEWVSERLNKSGISCRKTKKGALIAGNHPKPKLIISAHVDTLGAMIASMDGGTIRITQLGGWPLTSFEGEHLTVITATGKQFRGTLLLDNPAAHVNAQVNETKRSLKNMHVRLDAESTSTKDLRKLGLDVGDFVCFDTRFEYTDTGFVKTRFLDDKAGCACMITIAENFSKKLSELPIAFFFSNYEEVGHGAAAGMPESAEDLLAVDMGVVGSGPAGDEYHVSICAKDSSGPYDFDFRKELVDLARTNKIAHKVDVFPYYGSDGSAALRAGWELRVGLIGPGINASHGVERTHEKALNATVQLLTKLIESRY